MSVFRRNAHISFFSFPFGSGGGMEGEDRAFYHQSISHTGHREERDGPFTLSSGSSGMSSSSSRSPSSGSSSQGLDLLTLEERGEKMSDNVVLRLRSDPRSGEVDADLTDVGLVSPKGEGRSVPSTLPRRD